MMFARCCLLPPPFISAVRTRCFAGETSDTGLLFREKLIYLQDLNVDPHKALRVNPSLRAAPISTVVSVETLLSSTGLSRPAVGRILDMFPDLLTSDPESDILPVLRFLSDEIYLSDEDIPKSITRCPRLLISSVDFQLRPALAFLKTLGFVGRDTVTSRNTVLLVSSVERTLIPKIEFLEEGLGFTRDEVAKMVVRSPALLTYSVENNLAPKVEFFMEEMRGDVKELKRFPQYFSFSLERKIKPRHRLLKEHGILMPLSEMLKVINDKTGTVLGVDVCTLLSNLDAGEVLGVDVCTFLVSPEAGAVLGVDIFLTFDVCTFLVCIEAGAVLGVTDAGTVLGVDVCTSPANLVAGTVLGVNVCTSLANLNTGGGPWCRRLHITSQSRRWTPAHSY
ncbi:unnamed protein product [Brassica napus]|uniref:(rape) hypothetical protein n=1 Tax=Brassica napus TaxID=3708 RepID=A0A816SYJ4_BRANA|nr:unnamed protein product [Brassica napus]